MISKKISKNRIDPAAAVLNAFARAMYGASVRFDVSEFANKDFLGKLWN